MKRYFRWGPRNGEVGGRGYPVGPTTFYECTLCGAAVRSEAGEGEPWECRCGNVDIDPPQGRVGFRDSTKVKFFRDKERAASAAGAKR